MLQFYQSKRRCQHPLKIVTVTTQQQDPSFQPLQEQQPGRPELATEFLRNAAAAEGNSILDHDTQSHLGSTFCVADGFGRAADLADHSSPTFISANGEYLLFFDDDDVAMTHMTSQYMRSAHLTNADILTDFALQVLDNPSSSSNSQGAHDVDSLKHNDTNSGNSNRFSLYNYAGRAWRVKQIGLSLGNAMGVNIMQVSLL